MPSKIQTGVIGAGVIGLAVARTLAKEVGHEVLMLEAQSVIGSMISSRNSEVIHAGIYYPHSSLKRKFSVKGRNLLYEYCNSRNIEHRKCGKIIVATTKKEKGTLNSLFEQGKRNGVFDLKLLSREDVLYLEPNVSCEGGILSPSTGIIDSHGLMMSLLAEFEEYGGILSLNSSVEGGEITSDGITLHIDGMDVLFENVINCSGLFAHKVANSILPKKVHRRKQYFAKGNYFKLNSNKKVFSHLIYPVPVKGGLGVHSTIDLTGQCRFGPDLEWIDPETDPESIKYKVSFEREKLFYEEIQKYWPCLKNGELEADYVGVRPKLCHPDVAETLDKTDFLIDGPSRHGVPGLINLLGIESPGLTSCLSLADEVVSMVR